MRRKNSEVIGWALLPHQGGGRPPPAGPICCDGNVRKKNKNISIKFHIHKIYITYKIVYKFGADT